MSKKPSINIRIDDTSYKQIRKDKGGETIWWKNVPQTDPGTVASGLHVIHGSVPNHFDVYDGKQDTGEDISTNEGIGGIVHRAGKGDFVIPQGKVIVLDRTPTPKFLSPQEFEKVRKNYRVILNDNGGYPRVVAPKD